MFIPPYSPEKLDVLSGQTAAMPPWNSAMIELGGAPVFANFDPCAQNVSVEGVTTYFVRILPVTNGQPAGAPSNTVKITYDPNGEIKISFPVIPVPVATYYDLKILNYTGVHVPEYKYQFCVEVVENNAPQGSPWAGFKPGTVLCPETYKGGSGNILDDLSNAVEDAFNFISGLYNKLSDWVTETMNNDYGWRVMKYVELKGYDMPFKDMLTIFGLCPDKKKFYEQVFQSGHSITNKNLVALGNYERMMMQGRDPKWDNLKEF